jgi:hypothetical protein
MVLGQQYNPCLRLFIVHKQLLISLYDSYLTMSNLLSLTEKNCYPTIVNSIEQNKTVTRSIYLNTYNERIRSMIINSTMHDYHTTANIFIPKMDKILALSYNFTYNIDQKLTSFRSSTS